MPGAHLEIGLHGSLRQLTLLRQKFLKIDKSKNAAISPDHLGSGTRAQRGIVRALNPDRKGPALLQKTKGDSGGSSIRAAVDFSFSHPNANGRSSFHSFLVPVLVPRGLFILHLSFALQSPLHPSTHNVDHRDCLAYWHCQCT